MSTLDENSLNSVRTCVVLYPVLPLCTHKRHVMFWYHLLCVRSDIHVVMKNSNVVFWVVNSSVVQPGWCHCAIIMIYPGNLALNSEIKQVNLSSLNFLDLGLGQQHQLHWVCSFHELFATQRKGKLAFHNENDYTLYFSGQFIRPSCMAAVPLVMTLADPVPVNPDWNMRNKKFCSGLCTYLKRHVGFRSKRTSILCWAQLEGLKPCKEKTKIAFSWMEQTLDCRF
jgi:hypothetical protein